MHGARSELELYVALIGDGPLNQMSTRAGCDRSGSKANKIACLKLPAAISRGFLKRSIEFADYLAIRIGLRVPHEDRRPILKAVRRGGIESIEGARSTG